MRRLESAPDLRGLSLRKRIEAMISIAAPEHRDALRREAAAHAA